MEKDTQLVHADTSQLPRNGKSHPVLISSTTTLFWRVFMPVFGTVIWTLLLLGTFFFLSEEESYINSGTLLITRAVVFLLWAAWVWLVWRGLSRLKRVEADEAHLFVTNYWVNVRYPWQDVERIEEVKRLGRRIINIHLKAPGRFGFKISFLPGSSYKKVIEESRTRGLEVLKN